MACLDLPLAVVKMSQVNYIVQAVQKSSTSEPEPNMLLSLLTAAPVVTGLYLWKCGWGLLAGPMATSTAVAVVGFLL